MTGRSRAADLAGLIEAAAVFWFFYQALRTLFSVLFGLIYDALFAETGSLAGVGIILVVVILAFLSPLAAPGRPAPTRIARLAAAVVAFLARIALTFDVPQQRLVAGILIVAAAGVYLALVVRARPREVARALILALLIDLLVRTAGQTFDPTLRSGWWPGQVALSLVLCVLAGWRYRTETQAVEVGEAAGQGNRAGLLAGPLWGGWLFLETSVLAFPNAVGHLASPGLSDASAIAFVAVSIAGLSFVLLYDRIWSELPRWIYGIGTGLLVACLALATLLPAAPVVVLLFLAQYAALGLLVAGFWPRTDGRPHVNAALALGGVLFLVLNFAYAFTFTYAYTLDLFRGIGWAIFLLAGLMIGLPTLFLSRGVPDPGARRSALSPIVLLLALVVGVLAALAYGLHVPAQGAATPTVRIATYNMHYGYDTAWHLQLEAQAQTIEAADADVVFLQEVDTGRPTSYMIDDAHWLARRLEMSAVYLPTVEHQTGVALLSRYPIMGSDTLLLPSQLEQTGIIWALVSVDGVAVNVFGTWLGLEPEERARQLDAALPFVADHPGLAAWGADFNSTPDSPVYARIAGAGFTDPFTALGQDSPPTDPAIDPTQRIDFVWLRGLTPVTAAVSNSLASDHRLIVVEVKLP